MREAMLDRLVSKFSSLTGPDLHARLREVVPELNLTERFRLLHRLGIYHGRDSFSGEGSDTATTAAVRTALPGLFRDLRIDSLVDAPCGDCHWMAMADFCGVSSYLGLDLVGDLITANRTAHGDGNRRFSVGDITTDPLPRADLILCRDALIHLSNADALAALANFVRSGSQWLLTTSFDASRGNVDIASGGFRPIALEAPPFSLPRPVRRLADTDPSQEGLFPDRGLSLWRISEIETRMIAADQRP